MTSTTVAEFANELKKSTDTLLEQLKSAGVAKSAASDVLTDSDKHSLLNYLQNSHGTAGADRPRTHDCGAAAPLFHVSAPGPRVDSPGVRPVCAVCWGLP